MASLREHPGLPLRIRDALARDFEVARIDLNPDENQTHLQRRYPSRPAAHVRVKHARRGANLINAPAHDGERLLGRMSNAFSVRGGDAVRYLPRVPVQIRPRKLKIRHARRGVRFEPR